MPALLAFLVSLLPSLLLYFLCKAQHQLPIWPVYSLLFYSDAVFIFIILI